MSVQVRARREAAPFLSSYVGAQGELLVDTTNNRVQVHDGATPGGSPAAKLSEVVTNTRTAVADAAYAVLATDRTIAVTSLTAPRILTLPSAVSYPTGTQLLVFDESGSCSASNTITIARSGSDTINGAPNAVISNAYGYLAFESSGAGRWTIVDQTAAATAAASARTPVADASYAATIADRLIGYTSITAARTVTLPSASAYPVGTRLLVVDESGAASAANTITLARAGSDTINGAASATISSGYGYLAIQGNGASKWTITDQPGGASGAAGAVRYDMAQALTSAQQTQAVANLGGMLAGFRNRLVNGAMRVDQRNGGAAQTFAAGTALAYCVDRWYAYAAGANATGQQVSSGALTRYQFTGASGVTGIGFGQRIEAANSADLAGSTATLSVDLANSLLTAVTWTAYYATSADSFGTLASPTRTQIATGTFTVSSSPARYAAVIAIPSAATTGIELVLSVGAQTSGSWTIGNAQLETGGAATAFERRPIGFETSLCQRTYWVSAAFAGGWGGGTTTITVAYTFPVTMRIAPALTLLNGSVNGGSALELTVAQRAVSAISSNITNTSGGRADLTTAAASGGQRPGILEAGTLGFVAEL